MAKFLEEFSKGLRPYLVILAALMAFSLASAMRLEPLDRDESRFMQATTQMFETNDFVRISFQDEARNKKPIGIHWLQAGVLELTNKGLSRDAFYFRLVSLLGAYLCAISTFLIGQKLFDRKTGFLGAILVVSSVLLTTEAHIAKTDAALAGFIALSFYALSKCRFGAPNLKDILLFWAAFGFAVLIKGPVPIMAIGLMILLLWVLEKDIKWIRPIGNKLGLLLFCAITLPWFVLIGIKTDWQFYVEAIGKDLGEKVTGKQENASLPPGLHTLISPIILWPASIGFGAALMASIKEFKDSRIKFLISIIIPTWLVFELSTGKLAHYTLPVHFAIALLISYGLLNNYWRNWGKWLGVALFVFATLILSIVPIYLGVEYLAPKSADFDFLAAMANQKFMIAFLISISIFVISIIGLLFALRNKMVAAPILLFSALIFANGTKAYLLPAIDQLNVSRIIAQKLNENGLNPRLNTNVPALIGAGYQEPSLIFLTRSDSHLTNIDEAEKYAKNGAPYIVEGAKFNEFSARMAKIGFATNEKIAPIVGVNYSKGDDVIIHIGILTPIVAQ